jgi:branched-chain amino acid transport system substrate-binding protein
MNYRITKKITFYLFSVVFVAVGVLYSSPSVYAVEEVTVGVLLPLSGPIAPIGRTCKQALDYSAKEVNGEGGIKSLGGAKIKLVYTDSRGDPKIGMSEAERLILKENASVLLGSYQSSVTMTSSQVAERNKVPYLTLIAVADPITERGFKYVFRANDKASWLAEGIMKSFSEIGKQTGKLVRTVGLLYENTDFGQSSAKAWKQYAKKYDFQVVLDEPYPHGTTDITPTIIKFKNADPDAVLTVSYVSDIILIVKALAENQWRPKAFYVAGGVENEPEFVRSMVDLAEYHFNLLSYNDDILVAKPWARTFVEGFKKEYGAPPTNEQVLAYSDFYVLVDVLERAGSTDREKIREAFVKTNITQGKALILPYERIEFGPDGQNPHTRVLVCQWQKRKLRVVYPRNFVAPGVKLIWPTPSWGEPK